MLRINDISQANTALFLANAVRTAEYYGFVPFDELQPIRKQEENAGPDDNSVKAKLDDVQFSRTDESTLVPTVKTITRMRIGRPGAPSLFWKQGSTVRSGGVKFATLELHILGVPVAAAEAMLISAVDAIAHDSGIERRVVRLNSIGTQDSSMRYKRDVQQYLRKHLTELAPTLRAQLTSDPLGVLVRLAEKRDSLLDGAPSRVEYLNDEERRHFWDVLEYLEVSGLYYELDPNILGSLSCWAHTLFDISKIDDGQVSLPFARGGRYDALASVASNYVGRVSGVRATIFCEMRGVSDMQYKKTTTHPSIYFAHLGVEAKRHALPLIETLRSANIPIYHSLAHDHISTQMNEARKLDVAHILLMGHKEATEGTVLVRDVHTNIQEAVPKDTIAEYLKRRRIGVVS